MAGVAPLCFKIFCLEYYHSPPIQSIDINRSPLTGQYVPRVPVIRAYGTTPDGHKVCANIHGAFPYFFLCLPQCIVCEDLDSYCRSLAIGLETAVKKTANFSSDHSVVFDASLVSGRSIYGFQKSEQLFVKIHILDPTLISKCAELLLSGSVLNREFQPCEIHIPYLLQFCVDYNLYGMNYLQVGRFRLRTSKSNTRPRIRSMYSDAVKFDSDALLPLENMEKWSSVEYEIDIAAGDILNRLELSDTTIQNPGLEAMWAEEKYRRSNRSSIGTLPEIPTVEDLLPSSRPCNGIQSESEKRYMTKWQFLVNSSSPLTTNFEQDLSNLDERVSEWLNSSQSELDNKQQQHKSAPPTITTTSSLTMPSNLHDLESQSDQMESKPSSTQITLSSTGFEELTLLASLTEELDAWVPATNSDLNSTNLGWLRNKAYQLKTQISNSTMANQVSNWNVKWTSSPNRSETIKGTTCSQDDLLKSPFIQSQDLLESQSPSSSSSSSLNKPQLSTSQVNSKSILSMNWDVALEDVNEETLISNATQSVLDYHLNQTQNSITPSLDYVTEFGDDECFSQPVNSAQRNQCLDKLERYSNLNLDENNVNELWDQESPLPADFLNSLDLYDLTQPDSDSIEDHTLASSLNPITEEQSFEDQETSEISQGQQQQQQQADNSRDLLSFSSWNLVSCQQDVLDLSGPVNQSQELAEYSDLLWDEWSSNDDSQMDQEEMTTRHIPQLDGVSDSDKGNLDETNSNPVPKNPRIRRRLGLRLPTKRLDPVRTPTTSSSPSTPKKLQSSTPSVQSSYPNSLDLSKHSQSSKTVGSSSSPKTVESVSKNSNALQPMSEPSRLPFVLLERLDPMPTVSPSLFTSGRLSPSDEFEDIPIGSSTCHQLPNETSSRLDDQTSLVTSQLNDPNWDSSSLDFDNPGRLTLYSQTQLGVQSPSQTDLISVDTGQPSPSFQLPFWRPLIKPPSLDVVRRWMQARLVGQDSDDCPGEDRSVNSDGKHDLIDERDISEPHDKVVSTSQETNKAIAQTSNEPINASSDSMSASVSMSERISSVGSVSLLYQAASQRCYLPVQVDHTTTISLELHCQSRLVSSRQRKSSLRTNTSNPNSSMPNCRLQYGLIQDPNFDPIRCACLSVRHPTWNQCQPKRDLINEVIVIINKAEIPGASEYKSVRQLPSKYRLGLSRYLNNRSFQTSAKIHCHASKKRSSRNKHFSDINPLFIWCENEWSLISWIVYLVQCLDPEILVGYDVERHSWGYLVDRGRQLGRLSLPRELSRLCPDIMDCIYCSMCINECANLFNSKTSPESNQSGFFDSSTFAQNLVGSCQCPCNPIYQSGQSNSTDRRNKYYRAWPSGPGASRTGANFPCPGRVIFCLWRTLMHEISLFEYSLETVVKHLLKETMPSYTFGQLNQWFVEDSGMNRWRTVDYWIDRSVVNLRVMDAIDLIGRTSEFARVFGIEFYHVMSRGSQYRVESLLCRMAKQANLILPSPNVSQRARQRAPEAIPLNLEPESVLFVDGPVAVLDFQSLYPSIMIAYNYCYSTLVGRLSSIEQAGEGNLYDLGCLTHMLPIGSIRDIDVNVNISPNGVVFVNKFIREGILPRMLRQLLTTRLMVKDSMKLYKDDHSLTRLLDARQLGLKLMANVIFGYTAASFSGRMPCVDLGDSIVHKARETLEQSIDLIQSGQIELPQSCQGLAKPRVVYGDTDSMFVHLPGYGKQEAFDAANTIAQTITDRNPAPIKLKVEKIYYPCILEAKKRYCGYAYESPTQLEPKFDAKGIETVRRDSSPFVGKLMENVIKLLFDQFKLPDQIKTCPMNFSEIERLSKLSEHKVQTLVHQFGFQLIRGLVPFHDCLLARPFWGMTAYKAGAFAPALQVARRLVSMDPRAEPLSGERVVYYVAPGRPNQTLISCIRALNELYPSVSVCKDWRSRRALAPRLNIAYYLDKQMIPPLERMAQLMGWSVRNWLMDLPRYCQNQAHRRLTHLYHPLNVDSNRLASPSFQPLDSLGSPSSSLTQSPEIGSQSRFGRFGPKRFRRPSALMRAFVAQPPHVCPGCDSIIPSFNKDQTDSYGHCRSCLQGNANLGPIAEIRFGFELNRVQTNLSTLESLCAHCIGSRSSTCDPCWMCTNILCPLHSQRLIAVSQWANLLIKYRNRIQNPPDLLMW